MTSTAAAEHTPGPWQVLPKVWNGAAGHFEGPGVFLVQDVATETVICDRRTPWPEKAAELEANARLIAAAPDLLFELQGLVHFADGYGVSGRGPVAAELAKWIAGAKAAIAKATEAPRLSADGGKDIPL